MAQMLPLTSVVGLVLLSLSMRAAADPAAPLTAERRLSPEQIEAVLAEAARKREAAQIRTVTEEPEPTAPRQLQGEVGVSIGTGGQRSAFGTAIVPLGDEGAAALSADFIDLGKRRDRR